MTHSGNALSNLTKILAVIALPMAALASSMNTPDHPLLHDTSEVQITIRDAAGVPVRDAHVTLHLLNRDNTVIETDTDDEGKVAQDIIPLNDAVQIQVHATGYQPFSTKYTVNGLVRNLVVRLKPQKPFEQMAAVEAPALLTAQEAVHAPVAQAGLVKVVDLPAVQTAPVTTQASPAATYKEAQWVARPTHLSAKARTQLKNAGMPDVDGR